MEVSQLPDILLSPYVIYDIIERQKVTQFDLAIILMEELLKYGQKCAVSITKGSSLLLAMKLKYMLHLIKGCNNPVYIVLTIDKYFPTDNTKHVEEVTMYREFLGLLLEDTDLHAHFYSQDYDKEFGPNFMKTMAVITEQMLTKLIPVKYVIEQIVTGADISGKERIVIKKWLASIQTRKVIEIHELRPLFCELINSDDEQQEMSASVLDNFKHDNYENTPEIKQLECTGLSENCLEDTTKDTAENNLTEQLWDGSIDGNDSVLNNGNDNSETGTENVEKQLWRSLEDNEMNARKVKFLNYSKYTYAENCIMYINSLRKYDSCENVARVGVEDAGDSNNVNSILTKRDKRATMGENEHYSGQRNRKENTGNRKRLLESNSKFVDNCSIFSTRSSNQVFQTTKTIPRLEVQNFYTKLQSRSKCANLETGTKGKCAVLNTCQRNSNIASRKSSRKKRIPSQHSSVPDGHVVKDASSHSLSVSDKLRNEKVSFSADLKHIRKVWRNISINVKLERLTNTLRPTAHMDSVPLNNTETKMVLPSENGYMTKEILHESPGEKTNVEEFCNKEANVQYVNDNETVEHADGNDNAERSVEHKDTSTTDKGDAISAVKDDMVNPSVQRKDTTPPGEGDTTTADNGDIVDPSVQRMDSTAPDEGDTTTGYSYNCIDLLRHNVSVTVNEETGPLAQQEDTVAINEDIAGSLMKQLYSSTTDDGDKSSLFRQHEHPAVAWEQKEASPFMRLMEIGNHAFTQQHAVEFSDIDSDLEIVPPSIEGSPKELGLELFEEDLSFEDNKVLSLPDIALFLKH